MTHNPSCPLTRRTFLGAAGLTAAGFTASALKISTPDHLISIPSEVFGTISPETAGLSKEVEAKLTAYLQSQIDAGVIPGAYAAAAHNGKVFLETALGTYCNRTAREMPYDGRALHPVHSISKTVSATVIAMAWQDGLIDIDVPLMEYIPEFGCEGKETITIRQLMSHSAGIPTNPLNPMDATTEAGWNACVDAICKMPVEWAPGSRSRYHGLTGMFIAGEAVRRASSRKTWNQICRERLFAPLGLHSFTFEQPPARLPLACIPRLKNPAAQWQDQLNHFYGHPAAGLKGVPADVLKFLSFHTQKGKWNGKTLLKEKYWTALHTLQFPDKPEFENWGLGMMIRGSTPSKASLGWFGLGEVDRPNIFTHAGTGIALAAGDPDSNIQVFFVVTDNPSGNEKATELRNTVLATIFE
jgi:CubicO group peptidase (beta-lactamase class C family)